MLGALAAGETARSVWEIHRGHLLLLAAWVIVVGAVTIGSRLRSSGRGQAAGLPRSGWLWSAAAATAVSGAIHLAVIREHFAESVLYGLFFLVLAAAQFAWAIWAVVRPSVALVAAGAAASLAVVLLWLATRIVGIPVGPAAGEREPFGWLDVSASAAEVAVGVCAVAALSSVAFGRRGRVRASVFDGLGSADVVTGSRCPSPAPAPPT